MRVARIKPRGWRPLIPPESTRRPDDPPVTGSWTEASLAFLKGAWLILVEYDARILHWLARWDPGACAEAADLVTRAHAAGHDAAAAPRPYRAGRPAILPRPPDPVSGIPA